MSIRITNKSTKCIIPTRGKNLRIDSLVFNSGLEGRATVEFYYKLEPILGPIRKSRQLVFDLTKTEGNTVILNQHLIMGNDIQNVHLNVRLRKKDLVLDVLVNYSFPEPRKEEFTAVVI